MGGDFESDRMETDLVSKSLRCADIRFINEHLPLILYVPIALIGMLNPDKADM